MRMNVMHSLKEGSKIYDYEINLKEERLVKNS